MFNMTHEPPVQKLAQLLYDGTMVLPRIGPVQYAVLEHLAAIAQRDKATARFAKRRWDGGWTHVRLSRQVRAETIDKGLVQSSCCSDHGQYKNVRISRLGVQLLEAVRGEEILA